MAAQNDDKPEIFIVDGSNIATEGRSKPSLEQLNEAVAAFRGEYPDVKVTVVVDATFGHRIARKEVKAFDKAVAANELVTPPAGAVGRGDAFILAIADKADAGVFSNDSFQEFHGEYEWLFDSGRLIGGKPVPHVGWVFVDRNPVRGRRSRESVKAAKGAEPIDATPTEAKEKARRRVRKKKAAADDGRSDGALPPSDSKVDTGGTGGDSSSGDGSKRGGGDSSSGDGSRRAAADSSSGGGKRGGGKRAGGKRGGAKRRGDDSSDARGSDGADDSSDAPGPTSESSAPTPKTNQVNDPAAFFDFVEHHSTGAWVTGVVDSYASHGAYAKVGDVLVYIPLRLMADPAPTSARKVLKTGENVELVIVAFVPDRLSIDAALPAMAPSRAGEGSDEEPGADARDATPDDAHAADDDAGESPPEKRAARRRSKQRDAGDAAEPEPPVTRAAGKKRAARKAAAKKAPAKQTATKKAPAKKSAAKKSAAKKSAAKKAPAKKTATRRRAPTKQRAAAQEPSS